MMVINDLRRFISLRFSDTYESVAATFHATRRFPSQSSSALSLQPFAPHDSAALGHARPSHP
jgi:hypothetical protein